MVDKLRRSLEELEPPICRSCDREMEWSRSTLASQHPITILHLFLCPNCRRVSETTSSIASVEIPPTKLSAPHRSAAA